MRVLAVILSLLVLSACTAPPSLDGQVVAELRQAITTTCTQLGIEAPPDRAIQDQAGLLAIQSPPERQAAIRDGRMNLAAVQQAATETLDNLTRVHGEHLRAPKLMLGLVGRDDLDRNQLLLLDALTSQVVREAHLDAGKKQQ